MRMLFEALFGWLLLPNTCKARGCGEEVKGNDGRCAVCRRWM